MPKSTLTEIFSLPDVLLQDNFDLLFTSTPPQVMNDGEARQFRLQCMSTSLPGRTLETAPVSLFGQEIHFAGRNTTTHTFNATFVETRRMYILRVLDRWIDLCRSKETGHGVSKQYYAGRAELILWSEGGQEAGRMEIINIFPDTLPEVPMDGAATGIIQLAATFKFDTWKWLNNAGAGPTAA